MNKVKLNAIYQFQDEQNDRWLQWLAHNYPDFNPEPSHDGADDEEIREFFEEQDMLWDEFLEYESGELGITAPSYEYPNEEEMILRNGQKKLPTTLS